MSDIWKGIEYNTNASLTLEALHSVRDRVLNQGLQPTVLILNPNEYKYYIWVQELYRTLPEYLVKQRILKYWLLKRKGIGRKKLPLPE